MSENTTTSTLPGLEPSHTWRAEMARVSAFAMPGAALTPKSWKDVFGSEPEEVMRQPSMPSLEGGVRDGARWLITQQPGRADVLVGPEPSANLPADILTVGEFGEVLPLLLSFAAKAFDPTANVQRLAVGAVLLYSISTLREGLRKIQTFLPLLHQLPENATDFLFQMNVPTVINEPVRELLVNRLMKLQVANIHLLGLIPGSTSFPQLGTAAVRPVVRLELDINTSPEKAVALPADKIQALLGKLGDIALTLAKTGALK